MYWFIIQNEYTSSNILDILYEGPINTSLELHPYIMMLMIRLKHFYNDIYIYSFVQLYDIREADFIDLDFAELL